MADVIERVVWIPLVVGKGDAQADAVEIKVGGEFFWNDVAHLGEVTKIEHEKTEGATNWIRCYCLSGYQCVLVTNGRVDFFYEHNGEKFFMPDTGEPIP